MVKFEDGKLAHAFNISNAIAALYIFSKRVHASAKARMIKSSKQLYHEPFHCNTATAFMGERQITQAAI